MNVLITGGLGWLGKALTEALDSEHNVTAFDLEHPEAPREDLALDTADRGRFPSVQVRYGDVTDYDSVSSAMAGQDAVVHAAIASTVARGLYKAHDPVPFDVNVRGAYNVFEAARQCGVPRIVLIASAETHVIHPQGTFVDHTKPYRGAGSIYDLTKSLQEEVARWFCDLYGMNITALRNGDILDMRAGMAKPVGYVKSADGGSWEERADEMWQESIDTNSWIDRYDIGRACLMALERDGQGFEAFHLVAAPESRKTFDVDRSERALGFKLEQDFDLRPASQREPA